MTVDVLGSAGAIFFWLPYQVPGFIEKGDMVVVDTSAGTFVKRASK